MCLKAQHTDWLLIESCCYIAKNNISSSRFVGLEFCAVGKNFFWRVRKIAKSGY